MKQVKFAQVKTAESDNPNGEFEAVLSMATKDRDGEVIESGAFDPLPDHITIDVDHGLSASTTVGSGTPFYDEDGSLKIRGTFASRPLAQEIRSLVAEGHVRHMSVAFMGSEKEKKDGTPHITKAELLNAAFVAVPSNREAVVLSAKGLEEKAGARNSATDAGLIQEMHDMSISLGAVCSTKHAHTSTEPTVDSVATTDLPDSDETRSAEPTSDAAKAAPDAETPADTVPDEVKAALEVTKHKLALL